MNFLTKLFKKKKYDIGIIRFGDNIVIPGRDYFKNEEEIEILQEYKKHYIEKLKNNKVTTLSFNSDMLKKKMNMNVDLILKILMDNDDFYLLAAEELIIQFTKLKMYYEEIKTLEKETILRLVALKEIEKAKKIPRYNKMTLEEEINGLSIILEMHSYRKAAISIELKNYYDVLCTKDLKNQDNNVLNERLNKLFFITRGVVKQEEINKYEDIKAKIAMLEVECERYAYNNKEEAIKIKASYDLYNLPIESKILLFYEYGRNYYDESFMRKFYQYKFDCLTSCINNRNITSPITKEDYGLLYYKAIISNKIENIQNSYYFSNLASENIDISSLLENAKNYLKNEYGEFDYEKILTDKLKLAFILSLDYKDGLRDFFYKNMYSGYTDTFDFLGIDPNEFTYLTWSSSVSLASIMEILINNEAHLLKPFYELNKIPNNLLIPDGVESIDFDKVPKEYVYKKARDLLGVTKIEFSHNLKRISGQIGFAPLTLKFNDGLEYIGTRGLTSNAVVISIPSSVENISPTQESYYGIIEFRDFKNSRIINNKEKLIQFIKSFSAEIKTGRTEVHYPSKRNLEIQEKYRKGHFSTFDHAALFDHKYTNYIYKSLMTFRQIRFSSKDLEKPVVITVDDLSIEFKKTKSYYNKEELVGYPDYSEVYQKIRNILLERTGYDISNEEKAKTKAKK